jgi:hypothetical protein
MLWASAREEMDETIRPTSRTRWIFFTIFSISSVCGESSLPRDVKSVAVLGKTRKLAPNKLGPIPLLVSA